MGWARALLWGALVLAQALVQTAAIGQAHMAVEARLQMVVVQAQMAVEARLQMVVAQIEAEASLARAGARAEP